MLVAEWPRNEKTKDMFAVSLAMRAEVKSANVSAASCINTKIEAISQARPCDLLAFAMQTFLTVEKT